MPSEARAQEGVSRQENRSAAMARKKQPVVNYVMFDVFYQDGTRTSHRKVPAAEPYEQDFEARVKATIEAQDREIAEKSGRPRGPIKSIVKSAGQ
jgi:hypothetical protein